MSLKYQPASEPLHISVNPKPETAIPETRWVDEEEGGGSLEDTSFCWSEKGTT